MTNLIFHQHDTRRVIGNEVGGQAANPSTDSEIMAGAARSQVKASHVVGGREMTGSSGSATPGGKYYYLSSRREAAAFHRSGNTYPKWRTSSEPDRAAFASALEE